MSLEHSSVCIRLVLCRYLNARDSIDRVLFRNFLKRGKMVPSSGICGSLFGRQQSRGEDSPPLPSPYLEKTLVDLTRGSQLGYTCMYM